MKSLVLFAVASLSLALAACAENKPFTGIQKTVLRKQGDDGVHTYRIPGITTTRSGLICRASRSSCMPSMGCIFRSKKAMSNAVSRIA